MLKWLFGRREAGVPPEEAVRDERHGPEPPPPPTANRPGVTVHAATGVAALAGPPARPGASRLGPHDGGPLDSGLAWAAVVLTGPERGDVVAGPGLPGFGAALLDGVPGEPAVPPVRIPRDALVGTGVPGITGARILERTPCRAIVRLGPPPGARWVVVGLRTVAVLTGRLTLVDGDEGHEVGAGQVALVADPTATLYVQAGNDAAVAVGFASPGVVIRLG